MSTHFDLCPSDEAEQAPCGTWLGETSNNTSNWAYVDCGLCRRLKAKICAAHEASEAAIVEQMGDMAAYMRASAIQESADECQQEGQDDRRSASSVQGG